MKTVIVGNSGSGKTWLATRLAAIASGPVVHLDELFWEPGGFDRKRQKMETSMLIEEAGSRPAWVVEGVFEELAAEFLASANLLIWLDLDWVCWALFVKRIDSA
jgi:adenylate kinase family enzyme